MVKRANNDFDFTEINSAFRELSEDRRSFKKTIEDIRATASINA